MGRCAFTLIELVVVIGIIIVLVAIAVPAVGPALSSNYQSQAVAMFTGAIAQAQSRGAVGIRIERAFKTDKYGFMVDNLGSTPEQAGFLAGTQWLDYQQIRFLKPTDGGIHYEPSGDPIKLPAGAWLAPTYALDTTIFDPAFLARDATADPAVFGQAAYYGTQAPVPYSPLDTFYIGFDANGAISNMAFSNISPLAYHDVSQVQERSGSIINFQYVRHPHPSARGVIIYERKAFLERSTAVDRGQYLQTKGKTYYINRFLGTLIGGENQ